MATHFIEFRTREGLMALINAEELGTILESTTLDGRGRTAAPIMYVSLRNNNRIEVVNETRESMLQKIESCTGIQPIILRYEAPVEVDPEPVEG